MRLKLKYRRIICRFFGHRPVTINYKGFVYGECNRCYKPLKETEE